MDAAARDDEADDERWMGLALEACRRGIAAGQSPFGACIVRAGSVLACAHNQVRATSDPTAHAEVQAIRLACADLAVIDLTGATIYSTTEPCPMCFSAIHWARIGRIVYGATIADAASYGFNELPLSNLELRASGRLDIAIDGGLRTADALGLFAAWSERSDAAPY